MDSIDNKESFETDENIENDLQNNGYLDMFFTACEYSGEFWGKLSASVINNTTYYTQIGLEGLKKSNNKYMDKVTPAFNDSKEKIIKTIYKD